MLSNTLLIFLLVVGLAALTTLVAYLWVKDPFKTALGSCLSSLAILIGGLSMPDLTGAFDVNLDIGFASVRSAAVQVHTATPVALWITAFLSVVLLTALFATLLFYNQRPLTSRRSAPAGGIGEQVF